MMRFLQIQMSFDHAKSGIGNLDIVLSTTLGPVKGIMEITGKEKAKAGGWIATAIAQKLTVKSLKIKNGAMKIDFFVFHNEWAEQPE